MRTKNDIPILSQTLNPKTKRKKLQEKLNKGFFAKKRQHNDKKCYSSLEEADAYAHINDTGMRAYKCMHCPYYHVGHLARFGFNRKKLK